MASFISLSQRALFSLGGEERKTFLQGLVSADVTKVASDRMLYGAFLTPQGRFLHEFFLGERGEILMLETETERRADFLKRLSIYKLRAKVTLEPADDWRVFALSGDDAAATAGFSTGDAGQAVLFGDGVAFIDPRLPDAGVRVWLPAATAEATLTAAGVTAASFESWDENRLRLGLPDGSRDLVPSKTLLLEAGFDEMNGIDWKKGCYLGQELTARTKYRGLLRKRLLPVRIEGPAPEAGESIRLNDSEAGEMRSHAGSWGLALLRLEILKQAQENGDVLRAGQATLHPIIPSWVVFS